MIFSLGSNGQDGDGDGEGTVSEARGKLEECDMVEDKGQMLEESDSSHQCNILIKAKDTNKERVLGSSIGDPWYTCPK